MSGSNMPDINGWWFRGLGVQIGGRGSQALMALIVFAFVLSLGALVYVNWWGFHHFDLQHQVVAAELVQARQHSDDQFQELFKAQRQSIDELRCATWVLADAEVRRRLPQPQCLRP